MRAVFLTANYFPSVGGAQLHVQQIAEGLVRDHGWKVEVITTDAARSPGKADADRIGPAFEVVNGVVVRRLPYARRLQRSVSFIRRIAHRFGFRRFVRRTELASVGPLGLKLCRAAVEASKRADVVVAVAAAFSTVPMVRYVSARSKTPFVTLSLIHLSSPFPPFPSAVRSIRCAAAAVVSTEEERGWAVSKGVDPVRAIVIPVGCDPNMFVSLRPSEAREQLGLPEAPTVGYVGRMAAYKGIDTLAAAMEQLWVRYPDVRLLLAGSAAGWPGYQSVIDRLERAGEGRVSVVGRFPDDDKARLFAACDLVAFPSSEESFGLVTLESWCARRAPVVGAIDVARSLVRDGVDGVLVPVGEPDAWAEAIGRLLDDPLLADELGRVGRSRAESEFGWSEVVDQWNDVLKAAAADGQKARS